MKKTKNVIIVCLIIIVIGLITYIIFSKTYKEDETTKSMKNIAEAAKNYIDGTNTAESHLNEFSYNYSTGQVEYHPKITLEMYNRVKEGMTEKEVVSILGNNYKILDGTILYSLIYGKTDMSDGYLISIHIDKDKGTVFSKNQEGLE